MSEPMWRVGRSQAINGFSKCPDRVCAGYRKGLNELRGHGE